MLLKVESVIGQSEWSKIYVLYWLESTDMVCHYSLPVMT